MFDDAGAWVGAGAATAVWESTGWDELRGTFQVPLRLYVTVTGGLAGCSEPGGFSPREIDGDPRHAGAEAPASVLWSPVAPG